MSFFLIWYALSFFCMLNTEIQFLCEVTNILCLCGFFGVTLPGTSKKDFRTAVKAIEIIFVKISIQ